VRDCEMWDSRRLLREALFVSEVSVVTRSGQCLMAILKGNQTQSTWTLGGRQTVRLCRFDLTNQVRLMIDKCEQRDQ
jgi:hypothetical protein